MTRLLRIAAYNVEWFAGLFDDEDQLILDDSWSARHGVVKRRQAEAVAEVVRTVDADIMLIVEAPNDGRHASCVAALEGFADQHNVRPNGKNVIRIQFYEGPIPKLVANGAAKHIGLHWKGDTDGEADNDQLHNNPLGQNRKERPKGALSSPVTES